MDPAHYQAWARAGQGLLSHACPRPASDPRHCASLCREAATVEPLHPAAAAQEEGGAGPLLQRPDHRVGEEVRDAEIPLPAGEEAPGQDAAAQREAGEAVPPPRGTAPPSRSLQAPPCSCSRCIAPGHLAGSGSAGKGFLAGSCFLLVAWVRLRALTGSKTTPHLF